MKEKFEILSPFRYPGGKADLASYVKAFAYENILNGSDLTELYAGGASISLSLLFSGVVPNVTLVEIDPLVAAFWKAACNNTEEICKRIHDTKVSIGLWTKCNSLLQGGNFADYSIVDLAYAALVLNRTSYSGILHAGPIGGFKQKSKYDVGCRFYKETLIRRIELIGSQGKKIKVVKKDAVAYLDQNVAFRDGKPDTFLYVDPPYFDMGPRLYRHSFDYDDHVELCEYLKAIKTPWLLSYDDHPEIRKLYRGLNFRRFNLHYHVSDSRSGRELLISNVYLPPVSNKIR